MLKVTKVTIIVTSAEFSVPGCRVKTGTAKTQPAAFKSHFRPGEPLTCNSPFHSNGSDHQKRNALSFFREKLKPSEGPEERRQYPPAQLPPPLPPPTPCKNNKQLTAEHIMQRFGRPSFPTSANCCSPRKKEQRVEWKEGEAEKGKCQGRRTHSCTSDLSVERITLSSASCVQSFCFPLSLVQPPGVGGNKNYIQSYFAPAPSKWEKQ